MASNGNQSSRGVAIMCDRNLSYTTTIRCQDDRGRLMALDLVIAGITYSIISIYAPTQDKPREQLETLEKLEQFLQEMESTNIIIGGDFNFIFDPNLDKNSSSPSHPAARATRAKITTMQDDWALVDIWRIRNPTSKNYTFRRGNYASRLDFFLISAHLSDTANNIKIQLLAHSDHALISCDLRPTSENRGPGLWRFDASLLSNKDFMTEITQFLTNWTAPEETLDPNSLWEWLKFELQNKIRHFTKNLHSVEKQHINALNKELNVLQERADQGLEDLTSEIESTKRELKEVEEAKARKTIFRARCNWSMFGERPTKYFLNLEKRRREEGKIHEIITQDGKNLTNIKDILREGHSYYEKLFSGQENSLLPIPLIRQELSHLQRPELSQEFRDSLETPFTQAEFKEALSHLNTGKTPGTDGLTPEFYTAFWDLLAPHLYNSLLFSIQEGTMSTSQRRGVITLIPKKD